MPVIESLEIACRCMAASVERGRAHVRMHSHGDAWPAGEHVTGIGAAQVDVGPGIDQRGGDHRAQQRQAGPFGPARSEGRTFLLEPEARALLEAFDVPLVPATFCRTSADADAAARSYDGNVAVRVVSPAAPHKTEAGGVALNIPVGEVAATTERVFDAVRRWAADRALEADVRGVLVSPMLPRPAAELIVGFRRDPQFGPVLTVGAGGTDVEWLHDVAIRVLPVSTGDVDAMLDELRMAPVLRGYRGARGVHRETLVQCILGIAACALAHPAIAEMEVNPLFAYDDHATAVDVRVFLD